MNRNINTSLWTRCQRWDVRFSKPEITQFLPCNPMRNAVVRACENNGTVVVTTTTGNINLSSQYLKLNMFLSDRERVKEVRISRSKLNITLLSFDGVGRHYVLRSWHTPFASSTRMSILTYEFFSSTWLSYFIIDILFLTLAPKMS